MDVDECVERSVGVAAAASLASMSRAVKMRHKAAHIYIFGQGTESNADLIMFDFYRGLRLS